MLEAQLRSGQDEAKHDEAVGQACSKHEHCAKGYFCSGERVCEPDKECHFHHDAIDKKCPAGATRAPVLNDDEDDL